MKRHMVTDCPFETVRTIVANGRSSSFSVASRSEYFRRKSGYSHSFSDYRLCNHMTMFLTPLIGAFM